MAGGYGLSWGWGGDEVRRDGHGFHGFFPTPFNNPDFSPDWEKTCETCAWAVGLRRQGENITTRIMLHQRIEPSMTPKSPSEKGSEICHERECD